jgi:hypothetical protein
MTTIIERATRVVDEVLRGKLDDRDWRAKWQWHNSPAGARPDWDARRIVDALMPLLRPFDLREPGPMFERIVRAHMEAQIGAIDDKAWRLSYRPNGAQTVALRQVLAAMMAATPEMLEQGCQVRDDQPRSEYLAEVWTRMVLSIFVTPPLSEGAAPP